MTIALLSDSDITTTLQTYHAWSYNTEKQSFFMRASFDDYIQALDYVTKISAVAETQNHHPNICFGWGYVTCRITTHDAGGVTQKDVAFIEAVEVL